MPSRNATVAEAVKTALNATFAGGGGLNAAFRDTFVAKRVYVPFIKRDELTALIVSVYSATDEQDRLTRGTVKQHAILVQVGIQAPLSRTADASDESANTEIDALTELAEQVADSFGPGEGAYGGADWIKTAHAPIAYPEHLKDLQVFTSLVSVTFRIITPA